MTKGRKLFKRALLILVGIGVSVCLFLAGFLVISGYDMYREAVEEKSLAQRVEEVRSKPGYTAIDQLPEVYLQAVVAVGGPPVLPALGSGPSGYPAGAVE